jgi:hypothetical protein
VRLLKVGHGDIRLLVSRPPQDLQAAQRIAAEHFVFSDAAHHRLHQIPEIACQKQATVRRGPILDGSAASTLPFTGDGRAFLALPGWRRPGRPGLPPLSAMSRAEFLEFSDELAEP